jgi:hypothetical protein
MILIGVAELLVLAAMAVAAVAVVRALWRPTRSGAGEPSCGACGYSATGLESFTCPECGNDLRRVGILTPHTLARRPSYAAGVVLFTGLWAFTGTLAAGAVGELVPELRRYQHSLVLSSPKSRAYGAAEVRTSGRAWGDGRPTMNVTVELLTEAGMTGPVGALWVEPRSGRYHFEDTDRRRFGADAGFGPDAVAAWLSAAGVKSDDPRVEAEARRIAGAVWRGARGSRIGFAGGGVSQSTSTGADPQFRSARVTETVTSERPPWPVAAFVLVWVLAWAGGLRYLWQMTRRPHA